MEQHGHGAQMSAKNEGLGGPVVIEILGWNAGKKNPLLEIRATMDRPPQQQQQPPPSHQPIPPLNSELPWYAATTTVVLLDIAQAFPGVHELTAPAGTAPTPFEWGLQGAFALATLVVCVASFMDWRSLFAEAVFASGGLYAVTAATVSSSIVLPPQTQVMLGMLCAGAMTGLFTLWLALRRLRT